MRIYRDFGLLVLALMVACYAASARAQDGIVTPQALPPFNAQQPRCSPPPSAPRVLYFAQDNERQFMQGAAAGLAASARDRKLELRILLADNDPTRMIQQVDEAGRSGVGALIAAPINAITLAPSLKALINGGAYVGSIVPPPAVTILNAPQFLTGKTLADAAANYIVTKLGGRARVVLLTHDSNQFLAHRFVAMRRSLKHLPGVKIVADISPVTVNKQGGYEAMKKILVAHQSIDVVLGADTVVLGALTAVREAGRSRGDQFFGGIDGEPEAIAELKKGGEYKVSVSLASPVFTYALGQYAADWLEGKSVPQAMDILPVLLSSANIAQYESDVSDPSAIWKNPDKRDRFLRMFGNICYETRDQFLNFSWSSERN